MTALRVRELEAGYGEWSVLDRLGLEVGSGAVVGIVGPNGAGKTTLMNALAGRLRPSAGTIEVDGADWTGLPVHARVRLGLAYVPEDRGIAGTLTVEETFRVAGSSQAGARMAERTYEVLPQLRARARVPAQNLSGGEQQMLAIARALALEPRLLLLDEPTLGLAPMMVEIVAQFIAEARATVVLAEQNLRFVERVAGEVLLLSSGRLERIDAAGLSTVDELFGIESTVGADAALARKAPR